MIMKRNSLLKSILGLFLCVLCGCNNSALLVEDTIQDENVTQFMSGDILITISTETNIQSRSASMSDYYIVTGERDSIRYSIYVESIPSEDGLTINKIYSQEGDWLFSEVYFDEKLISNEFASIDEDQGVSIDADTNDIELSGSRRPGESYKGCVRRVHKTLKEKAEINTPVTCEFISCGALAAVVGIIDCAEYGNQF